MSQTDKAADSVIDRQTERERESQTDRLADSVTDRQGGRECVT